jgi:predicted nucleic acid-binding protein
VIYLDTSVALAALFAEDRRPPTSLWAERLISSRLLDYELSVRANARGHRDAAEGLIARVGLVELAPTVLERAREPFPVAVRTLDALHLATALYLRQHGQRVQLASYDERMLAAAEALGLPVWPGSLR